MQTSTRQAMVKALLLVSVINGASGLSPVALAQPPLFQTGGAIRHAIPVPQGYIDISLPNSPASAFWNEQKALMKEKGLWKEGTIATLVKQADLASYYANGPSPFQGHYQFVSFTPGTYGQRELNDLRTNFTKLTPVYEKLLKELSSKKATSLKDGQVHQLGIIKDWGTGLILGNVISVTFAIDGKTYTSTKLMLTAFLPQKNGAYYVNDVSLVRDGGSFDQATKRLEAWAHQIAAANP